MARIVKCNKCGKKVEYGDYYSISAKLKYGSKNDGRYARIDICIGCMDSLLDSMQICPFEEPSANMEVF